MNLYLNSHVRRKLCPEVAPSPANDLVPRYFETGHIGRVDYVAFIHHFISSYAFLLSCGKDRTHSSKLAWSTLFSTPLVISRDAVWRTFGLVLVRRVRSRVLSLRLPENVCKAPGVSLISVRSSRNLASFQRACLSFLGTLLEDHTRSVGPSLIRKTNIQ